MNNSVIKLRALQLAFAFSLAGIVGIVFYKNEMTPATQSWLAFIVMMLGIMGSLGVLRSSLPRALKRVLIVSSMICSLLLFIFSFGKILTGESSFMHFETWLQGGILGGILALIITTRILLEKLSGKSRG